MIKKKRNMPIKELYTTHKFANYTHWPAANIS